MHAGSRAGKCRFRDTGSHEQAKLMLLRMVTQRRLSPSPLKTLKAPGNSRYKETSYIGTKLGRWLSTLLLYGQIQTEHWYIKDKEVIDIAEGCYPLVVYWVEGMQ